MSVEEQLILNGQRFTQHLRRTTETRQRGLHTTMLEIVCAAQDENATLLHERHALQQEHQRALELIRTLANRGEAFRRLVSHLRQTWQPTDPIDAPLKENLKPLLEQKKDEVARDAQWTRERDADIEQRVRPAQGRR